MFEAEERCVQCKPKRQEEKMNSDFPIKSLVYMLLYYSTSATFPASLRRKRRSFDRKRCRKQKPRLHAVLLFCFRYFPGFTRTKVTETRRKRKQTWYKKETISSICFRFCRVSICASVSVS